MPVKVEDAEALGEDFDEEAEEMEPVEVEEDIAETLVEAASDALQKLLSPADPAQPIKVVRSAFVFTIVNADFDPIDDLYEDIDDDEEEDGFDEDLDDDADEYDVDLITSFTVSDDGAEKEYYIYRVIEPVIMLAEDSPRSDGKYNLIPDEESYDVIESAREGVGPEAKGVGPEAKGVSPEAKGGGTEAEGVGPEAEVTVPRASLSSCVLLLEHPSLLLEPRQH
eukprot:scaffold596_cov236-Pinguiococcus_pyrenoidosus.AAC.1